MDMIAGRSLRYVGLVAKTSSAFAGKFPTTQLSCLYRCDARRLDGRSYDAGRRWRLPADSGYLATSQFITARIKIQDWFPQDAGNRVAYSTGGNEPPVKDGQEPPAPQKQTIFQKMKQLTKDYWHILIPVHIVTSIGWGSIFYIAAKNGVDVVPILEALHLSERYLDILRGSNAGHWAVTYALYKLFTPIRYTVTVGGTTMAIRYLNRWGYLKFKPQSTIKGTQSEKCATENSAGYDKTGFKNHRQTEPPKT